MCHYYRQNQANLQAERNKERLTGDRKYAYTKGQSDRIKEHILGENNGEIIYGTTWRNGLE